MDKLQRFISVRDTGSVEIIWTCCILCLAHLAALSHFMGQLDSALSTSMNDLYDRTLANLGNLSLEPRIEEFSSFDVLTCVRIPQQPVPPNEARRLRYSTYS